MIYHVILVIGSFDQQTVIRGLLYPYYRKFSFSKCYSLLYFQKFLLYFPFYGVMKKYFTLLSHFKVVSHCWVIWGVSHLLAVALMLEYLRIFFFRYYLLIISLILFALNKQKKVKKGCVRNWKLYLKVEKY